MSSQKLAILLACSVAIPMLAPASLPAQGILRRLRERIAVPPPIPVPSPGLQGSRLPGSRLPGLRLPGSRVPASRPPTTLPARPYPTPTQPSARSSAQSSDAYRQRPSAAPTNASPTSRYQLPGNSVRVSPSNPGTQQPTTGRFPTTPTPATKPSAVAQASASEPIGSASREQSRQQAGGRSSFGRSILKPFGFNESPKTSNPSAPASTIGIQGSNSNPGYPGVQVQEFREYSMADDAGLRIGDYIFGLDGDATPDIATLAEKVAAHAPGETVSLRIGRDGRVSDLEIQLVKNPIANGTSGLIPATNPSTNAASPNTASPNLKNSASMGESLPMAKSRKIGAEVEDVDGMRGVVVTGIDAGSLAEAGGLSVQDRIIAIDGRMISNTSDLVSKISELSPGNTFDLRLVRNGQLVETTIPSSIRKVPSTQPTVAASSTSPGSTKVTAPADSAANAAANSPKSGGSLLGGLSSVLGGVFGGAASNPSPADGDQPASPVLNEPITETLDAPIEELMAPAAPTGQIEPVDVLALEPPAANDDKDKLKLEIERLKMQLKRLEQKVEQ